ncbi:LOW QUALITY PROTEIN: hypothetical protein MXB_5289 [Myxobolus squamalis]|nr:LOW QUALITY PROTEIN: hypothetical protein MXB_5289 [Myxobolus squamalis]
MRMQSDSPYNTVNSSDANSSRENITKPPVVCSTPFQGNEEISTFENSPSIHPLPSLKADSMLPAKVRTPVVRNLGASSGLPRPSFSSDPIKRRTIRPPSVPRPEDDYFQGLNLSVSFGFDCEPTKRKSPLDLTEKSQSFRIINPHEMMQLAGSNVVNSFSNPSSSAQDPWNFSGHFSRCPISEESLPSMIKLIGNGDSGQAFKCSFPDGKLAVAKRYAKPLHGNGDLYFFYFLIASAKMIKEAAGLFLLSHLNIVSYIDSYVKQDYFYIVIEYCNGLNLRLIIDKYRNANLVPSEQKVKSFLRQMFGALSHIHDAGIVHFDIKPGIFFIRDNIFSHNSLRATSPGEIELTENCVASSFDPFDNIFKLGDFGNCFISKVVNIDVSEGDSRYLGKEALEIFDGNVLASDTSVSLPSTCSDIFALGLTTAEYCGCGDLPNCGETWQIIRTGLLPKISASFSSELNILLTKMISPECIYRPTASDCFSNEFIRD